jgi:signal peptidase I
VPVVLPRPAAGSLAAIALLAALAGGPRVALVFAAGLAAALLARDLARTATGVALGRPPARILVGRLLARHDARSHSPREECLTALVGPLTLVLAAGLAAAGAARTPPGSFPHPALAGLARAALLLAAASLLPGLPTDGGRLVRATAWRLTGSRVSGTRAASRSSRLTAVAVGLVTLSALTAGDPAVSAAAIATGGPLAMLLWRGATRRRRPGGGRPDHTAGRLRAADLALAAGLAVVATATLRAYVVRTFSVDSSSMRETLQPGDRVLADRLTYRLAGVRRGDLVVVHRPTGAGTEEEDLVKRVIGLPGERVAARDGTVSVNGVPLVEPYAGRDCGPARAPVGPVLVPPGHLYLLGDNRCGSLDSRQLGPVDNRLVEGRIFGIVWPLARTGRF